MMKKLLMFFAFLISPFTFAQNGAGPRSVEMRPGTSAPDLPSHNLIRDRPSTEENIDEEGLKLKINESKMKEKKLPKTNESEAKVIQE